MDVSLFWSIPLIVIWYAVGYRHGVRAEKTRAYQIALDEIKELIAGVPAPAAPASPDPKGT